MFTYTRLRHPSTEFRLLRLQPGFGSAPLQGELLTRGIDDSEQYDTLSYRCQDVDQSANHDILIEESRLAISKTVRDALFRLRFATSPRQLWIDQICIDQRLEPDSLRERGQQVKIMGKIYHNSRETIIWLGQRPSVDVQAGIALVQSVAEVHRQLEAKAAEQLATFHANKREVEQRTGTVVSTISDAEMLFGLISLLTWKSAAELIDAGIAAAADMPVLKDRNIQPVLAFFQSDYFLRIWPVQEVILSKRKRIYCGDFEVDWNLVGWFAGWCMHHLRDEHVESTTHRYLRDTSFQTPQLPSLWRVMVQSVRCNSTVSPETYAGGR